MMVVLCVIVIVQINNRGVILKANFDADDLLCCE